MIQQNGQKVEGAGGRSKCGNFQLYDGLAKYWGSNILCGDSG